MKKTLNQILAITDSQQAQVKGFLTDYINYFKKSQSDFKGEKKTYEPIPGYVDVPQNRYNKRVVTTVDEKMDYLKETLSPILKNMLTLEATNASGSPKAELIVGNDSWGEFTSLELLRLKSFISNGKLVEMIQNIPLRSDAKEWMNSEEEGYEDRKIFQIPTIKFEEKTSEKEEVILSDPNIERAIEAGKDINYSPQTTIKTKQVIIGNGSFREFSGEWSHHSRAHALKKLQTLKEAIIDALQRANKVEVIESKLESDKIFEYLFS